jgi:hypothetical protein
VLLGTKRAFNGILHARVGTATGREQKERYNNNPGGIAHMSKVRVAGFGVSLDGFSAGIEQSLHAPIGKRGMGDL